MWRRRHDSANGRIHVRVREPRTSYRVSWMLDAIIEGLEEGVDTAVRTDEKFALVIRSVCEIDVKKELAAARREKLRQARIEGRVQLDPAEEAQRLQDEQS